MRRRRRRITAEGVGASGGQLLALSLFVMLLAFFIVLNAISSYQQSKVAPVLKSLESSFASKISEEENEKPSVTSSEEKSISEGDTLDRIRALFVSQIPGHRLKMDKNTGTMHVALSMDDFEKAVITLGDTEDKDSEAVGKLKAFFLPALIALMENDAAGQPYRMDMIVNTPENPAAMENASPQRMRQMSQRMSRIAQQIESAGLPARMISIGMKRGDEGTIELFFRPHIPYNPLGEADEKR